MKSLFRRETDYEKLGIVVRQSEALLRERNLRGIAELVKRHRRSNPIITGIGIQLAAETDSFLFQPKDAVDPDVMKLMEALRKTAVVRKNGPNLQDAPADTTHSVYGVLAMHTVLLDTLQVIDFDAARPEPPYAEVQVAAEILKSQYESDIMHRLCRFVEGGYLPPFYIASIYHWEADLDMLTNLQARMNGPSCPKDPQQLQQLRVNIRQLENRMTKDAEQILEKMNRPLPSTYIEKLDAELQTLGWLARLPERIDGSHVNLQLLDKYGICRGAPLQTRCQQVEEAFRSLDARLSNLTGRRPYADELFDSLKHKTVNASKESFQKHRPQAADLSEMPPPTQGRRMKRR